MKPVRMRIWRGWRVALFGVSILLMSSGYVPAHAQKATLPADMLNVTWVLTAIERVPQQNVENTNGTGITIVFNEDGTASGSGGCNNFNTSYTAGANNALTFGPVAATRKFCSPEAVMNLEGEYFAALGSVTSYTLNQSDLSLTYNNGQSKLDFVFIGATSGTPGMPTTGAGDLSPLLYLLAIVAMVVLLSGWLIKRYSK